LGWIQKFLSSIVLIALSFVQFDSLSLFSRLLILLLIVFSGLWKGLGPRILMIGTLTALQWFIYDSVKVAFRLPRPPPPEMPESLKRKLEQKAAAH